MHWNNTNFLVLDTVFGSKALGMATSMFLFIACIRFAASDPLIDVLRKRHGHDLVKEIRILAKIDFNHSVNVDDFNVLATDSNKFKLVLRESFSVKPDKRSFD